MVVLLLVVLTACAPRVRHKQQSSGFYAPADCIDHIAFTEPCDAVGANGKQMKCQNVLVEMHCVAPVSAKTAAKPNPQHKIPVSYGDKSGKKQ